MGFFSKKKKNESSKQQEQELSQEQKRPEMDASVRPGGVFIMQLLMKERCDMPSKERMMLEPGWVMSHAYNMALYLLENDAPIKDGDTIDGIADGRIVQHIQWPCHFENAMLQPERAVLDVCLGEYAAGNRSYQ